MQRTLFTPVFTIVALFSFTSTFAAEPPTVLVARFNESGKSPTHPWIGSSLHRGLIAELSHDATAKPIVPDVRINLAYDEHDNTAAVDAGKAANAAYVIIATYEVSDQGLLVAGKTIRVPSGESAGPIEVAGGMRELFKVQAEVARQVKDAINGTPRLPRDGRIITPETPEARAEREAAVIAASGDGEDEHADRVLNIITAAGVQRAASVSSAQSRGHGNDAELTLEPGRDMVGAPSERASDISRGKVPARAAARPLGNAISGGPGNTAGPISGNTVGTGASGLTITGTPGSVMTGGSGNIFLGGPGNFINGGDGNFINGGDGNQIIQSGFNQIIGGDPRVMQGGDGNYIDGGSGNTIQATPGNTAGGISGNTATGGAGNSNSGAGNNNAGQGNTVRTGR